MRSGLYAILSTVLTLICIVAAVVLNVVSKQQRIEQRQSFEETPVEKPALPPPQPRKSKKTKKSKKSKKRRPPSEKPPDPPSEKQPPPTKQPPPPKQPRPSKKQPRPSKKQPAPRPPPKQPPPPKSLKPASSSGLSRRPVPTARVDVNDSSNNPADEWMKMANGKLVVWPRARLAGAVWSIRFDGKPFVAELVGNGGSWQSACFFNVASRSEEYNPTQAGSMTDVPGTSGSKLLEIASDRTNNPQTIFTRTHMAFFFDPFNTRTTYSEGKALPVKNAVKTSNVLLLQRLELLGQNRLRVTVTFTLPKTVSDRTDGRTQLTQGTFEFLAAYIDQMFTVLYTFHNRTLKAIASSETNVKLPCIVASKDGRHAIGVDVIGYSPSSTLFTPFLGFFQSPTDSVPKYNIDGTREHFDTPLSKFNLVSGSSHDHHMQGDYTFQYIAVFGSVQDVQTNL